LWYNQVLDATLILRACGPKDRAPASGAGCAGSIPARRIIFGASNMRQKVVSIIGGRQCDDKVERIAHELGEKLAKVVCFMVSGGLGGTMMAACEGFKAGGGTTIGITPGYDKREANSFVDVGIPTGLGLARNVLVVTSADIVVALPGGPGTLSEIAYCLQFGIPVISLGSWNIKGVRRATTVDQAVSVVKRVLQTKGTIIKKNLWSNSRKPKRKL
jgi:uncharacterized protein (TIGR00725 family)